MNEGSEHHVEFVEAGKDSAKGFEAAEETFDLVALFIEFPVVFPRIQSAGIGRHHRRQLQREEQLPGFIAFVSTIHHHRCKSQRLAGAPAIQEFSPFRAVASLPGREGET